MAGRGDIEAGRAFVELFLKNSLTQQLNGALAQARAGLSQFAKMAQTAGRALTRVGVAISASYIAIASGNAAVAQKAQLIHKTLANAIAPAVLPILQRTLEITQAFARWASHNQGIITAVLRIGLGMVLVGSGLKLAASAARALAVVLQVAQIAAANIALILRTTWIAPLLIVLATMAVIGALLFRYSSSWRQFFQQNTADAAVWAGNILSAIRSFVNAISDGRFQLAWRIVLLAAEIEWTKFNNAITAAWSAVVSSVAKMLQIAWDTALAGMKLAWAGFQRVIIGGWVAVLNPLVSLVEQIAPLLERIGINAVEFARAFRDTMKGMDVAAQERVANAWTDFINATKGKGGGEFFKVLDETLKGMVAVAKEGGDLKAMTDELAKMKKAADERLPFTPFGAAGQTKSTVTAAGAVALGFGSAAQDVARKSFEELQAIKKAAWETVKQLKEWIARREKPGIFGP